MSNPAKWEKYALYVDGAVIGFKLNRKTNRAVIGGMVRFRRKIRSVLEKYFYIRAPKVRRYQRSRITYKFKCTKKAMDDGLMRLEDDNYVVEEFRILGRLM